MEADITIPARDGYEIPIPVHKPQSIPTDGCPLVVMYHGGGFCLGDLDTETLNCRAFVNHFNAVCLNVDYRLGPEWPFPVAINDAWDALQWTAANYSTSRYLAGAAPRERGFVVGGNSAGANITAVLTHLARDAQMNPPITGQYLAVPLLLPPEVVPEHCRERYLSSEQNKHAPILPRAALKMFAKAYQPDLQSRLYVPFNDPSGHADIPPAYIQVCGMDPYRDENLIYESVLREDYGIKMRLDIYPGLPHSFWGFFPNLSSSERWRDDTLKGMGWLLVQEARTRIDKEAPIRVNL